MSGIVREVENSLKYHQKRSTSYAIRRGFKAGCGLCYSTYQKKSDGKLDITHEDNCVRSREVYKSQNPGKDIPTSDKPPCMGTCSGKKLYDPDKNHWDYHCTKSCAMGNIPKDIWENLSNDRYCLLCFARIGCYKSSCHEEGKWDGSYLSSDHRSGCPIEAVKKQLGKSDEKFNFPMEIEYTFKKEVCSEPMMCRTGSEEYYVDFSHDSKHIKILPYDARFDDVQIPYDPTDTDVPTDIVNFYLVLFHEWEHLLNEYIKEQVSLRKELCSDVDSCFPEHGCWYYGP
jgi:hypothetical protein